MHMADALLSPSVAGAMCCASALAAGVSIRNLKKRPVACRRLAPLMGVMGAFVFAGQMINFALPGTGSSGHIGGGLLLAALLGPEAGFLTLMLVLTVQCLLFADGGLMALGANVWNMGFYACFLGGCFIWHPLVEKAAMNGRLSKLRIMMASVLAVTISLQLGAFSVTVETLLSGISSLPFGAFVLLMQPIHFAIGVVEGLITGAVLAFVYEERPELLWTGNHSGEKETAAAAGIGHFAGGFAMAALVIAGGLSLLASENPDGLEWSIEKLTGSTELESSGAAAAIQQVTSLCADYGIPGVESVWGNVLAAVLGVAVVTAAGFAVMRLMSCASCTR